MSNTGFILLHDEKLKKRLEDILDKELEMEVETIKDTGTDLDEAMESIEEIVELHRLLWICSYSPNSDVFESKLRNMYDDEKLIENLSEWWHKAFAGKGRFGLKR